MVGINKSLFTFLFFCLLTGSAGLSGLTFFISSDPHYGRAAWDNNEAINKSAIDDMNDLPGTPYGEAGNDVVETPEGVLVPGDLTSNGHLLNWMGVPFIMDGFVDDYGVNGEGRLHYPVYEGYGNHDNKDKWLKGWPVMLGIKHRNQYRATPVTLDEASGMHYSWDWPDVHFVNLNLYPGETDYSLHSLDFLREDLGQVDPSQKVVLYFHYDLKASERWWTETEKEAFYEVIREHNIVGIFVGHSHKLRKYKWKGFDVYNAPSVKNKGEYLVVKINEGKMSVQLRSPEGWGQRWTKSVN